MSNLFENLQMMKEVEENNREAIYNNLTKTFSYDRWCEFADWVLTLDEVYYAKDCFSSTSDSFLIKSRNANETIKSISNKYPELKDILDCHDGEWIWIDTDWLDINKQYESTDFKNYDKHIELDLLDDAWWEPEEVKEWNEIAKKCNATLKWDTEKPEEDGAYWFSVSGSLKNVKDFIEEICKLWGYPDKAVSIAMWNQDDALGFEEDIEEDFYEAIGCEDKDAFIKWYYNGSIENFEKLQGHYF